MTPPAEGVECSTVKEESKEMSKTVNAIAAYMAVMADPLYSLPNISRSDIREAGACKSFAALAKKLKDEGARTTNYECRDCFISQFHDLVWYDYHSNRVISSDNLKAYGFLLPVPQSALPNGDIGVLFLEDATNVLINQSKGNKLMSTIKETAIKSKDQVIKTAIGQAGVAGIKSLILTALPMKIGFIGRLLGCHRQVANNSVVVAGIAILANQIGQQYVKNNSVKNALQATQDQALSEVLNEYVGIENKVDAVVTNSLQLDKQPVTLDQE